MKFIFAAMFSILLVCLPVAAHANGGQTSSLDNVTQLSDKALELAKEERYKEASEVLFYLSSQFGKGALKTDLGEDKIRMVDVTMEDTIETLGRAEEPRDVKIHQLTGVRLLVDALISDHQPLWKQTEYQLINPLKHMQLSLRNNQSQEYQEAANEFLANYSMIRPAVSMDVTDTFFDRVDKDAEFIDISRNRIFTSSADKRKLESVRSDFEKLFAAKEDNAEPSLFWLIFSIGGIIFSTLFYVGWRKYKAEKENVKEVEKR
ncbi:MULTISPECIES: sporulation protein YpjB [Fictibacillus]|uniref:Sporulation protein YpjB n=1 Tax=Fictibacillus terranigra TaxID=3058424 RepID=A0ABT8E9G4_9BACL|nr:sporulation protein YpjB [Fictibacillus sp. CENA-BCM004]MDN4074547.1 sporulation protein YpjB [Fictibacillus sp. CENA-BCM004]